MSPVCPGNTYRTHPIYTDTQVLSFPPASNHLGNQLQRRLHAYDTYGANRPYPQGIRPSSLYPPQPLIPAKSNTNAPIHGLCHTSIHQLTPTNRLAAAIRQQLAEMECKSKLPYDFKAIVETVCIATYALSCLSFLGIPSIVTLPLLCGMGLLIVGGAWLTGWRYQRQAKSIDSPNRVDPATTAELIKLQQQFCQQPFLERNFREQKEDIFLNMRTNLAIGIHHADATTYTITKALLRYAILRSLTPFLLSPLLGWLNKERLLHFFYRPFSASTMQMAELPLKGQQLLS